MAEVTCIIVDDEIQNQEVLARMINQFCPTVKVLGRAENVTDAAQLIESVKPDVVFLDIEMPGGNGFTLFDKIATPPFFTIFTTAHAEYAIKAIKFAAFDYLLKPINLTELKGAVEKVAEKLAANHTDPSNNRKMVEVLQANKRDQNFEFNKIALSSSEGLEFFQVNEILRCEADRAYCIFHVADKRKIIVSKSLKEYEDILEEANFFRVHKSNMVNMNHVKKYIRGKGGFVVLSDDSLVSVAIRKKDELMEILHKQKRAIEVESEAESF
jgi:two-component system, LytTR family, response regulator